MRFVERSHGIYSLSYHIVWVTKYRRRILNPGVVDYLKKMFPKLIRSIPGVEIEEIGFDKDHIHFVMVIPPKYSISDVIAQMKSQSASVLRERYKWLSRVYFKENIVWSTGFRSAPFGAVKKGTKRCLSKEPRVYPWISISFHKIFEAMILVLCRKEGIGFRKQIYDNC